MGDSRMCGTSFPFGTEVCICPVILNPGDFVEVVEYGSFG